MKNLKLLNILLINGAGKMDIQLRQEWLKEGQNLAEICLKKGKEIRGNSLWNFLPKNTVFFVNEIKAYLTSWNSWNFHGT